MEINLRSAREGAYCRGFEYALDSSSLRPDTEPTDDTAFSEAIDTVLDDDAYEEQELQQIRRFSGFQEVPVNTGRYERDLNVRVNYETAEGRLRTEELSCYDVFPELERMWWTGLADYVAGKEKYDAFTEGCTLQHDFHPSQLYMADIE